MGLELCCYLSRSFAGSSFPEVGELEEERLYLESEIDSEYSFEDIVGKSAALRKVLDQVAIVAPTSFDRAPAR